MHAEHGHHAIALHAHDHAVEIVDGVADERDRAVENVAGVFRIEHGDKPGGADDIGEEHGRKAHGLDITGQRGRPPVRFPGNRLHRLSGGSIESLGPHPVVFRPHDSPVESRAEPTDSGRYSVC